MVNPRGGKRRLVIESSQAESRPPIRDNTLNALCGWLEAALFPRGCDEHSPKIWLEAFVFVAGLSFMSQKAGHKSYAALDLASPFERTVEHCRVRSRFQGGQSKTASPVDLNAVVADFKEPGFSRCPEQPHRVFPTAQRGNLTQFDPKQASRTLEALALRDNRGCDAQ